jgi:tRNA G18 (ribose-2'-O)-methylase SpoU
MAVIPIDSPDDPRIGMYRALPKSQFAAESGLFITEGDKVTERMFGGRFQPHSLLLEASQVERFQAIASPELPIYVVEREIMLATVGFKFHRGVMGCGYRGRLPSLEEVVPLAPQPCLLAVCPELHDPTNLGTLIRTALALGVDALLLGNSCADPLSRRVIRVSMGATLHLPLVQLESLDQQLLRLRDEFQIELCATVLDATAEPLERFSRLPRTAVLFGSEGHGLSAEIVSLCQRRVTIPMPPSTDSLNAAVAAGIFLYHFSRPGMPQSG